MEKQNTGKKTDDTLFFITNDVPKVDVAIKDLSKAGGYTRTSMRRSQILLKNFSKSFNLVYEYNTSLYKSNNQLIDGIRDSLIKTKQYDPPSVEILAHNIKNFQKKGISLKSTKAILKYSRTLFDVQMASELVDAMKDGRLKTKKPTIISSRKVKSEEIEPLTLKILSLNQRHDRAGRGLREILNEHPTLTTSVSLGLLACVIGGYIHTQQKEIFPKEIKRTTPKPKSNFKGTVAEYVGGYLAVNTDPDMVANSYKKGGIHNDQFMKARSVARKRAEELVTLKKTRFRQQDPFKEKNPQKKYTSIFTNYLLVHADSLGGGINGFIEWPMSEKDMEKVVEGNKAWKILDDVETARRKFEKPPPPDEVKEPDIIFAKRKIHKRVRPVKKADIKPIRNHRKQDRGSRNRRT